MATYRFPWLSSNYTESYYPPAPVIPLEIAGPEMSDWVRIDEAFVDSGADWTIVPSSLIEQIAAIWRDRAWLRSQWGEARLIRRFEIDVRIANRTFPSLLVVEDDQGEELVLGRNFLQYVRAMLDGPAGSLVLFE